MKINIKYLIVSFCLLAMASCHKDDVNNGQGETTTPPTEIIKATSGDVLGYVYDEQGNPVGGAAVSILTNNTTTDQYGVFKFKNIELDQQGTYLRVSKSGYILGSDMIYGLEDANHTSRVQLLALSNTGNFSSSAGGTVNADGGGKVVFAANSIETANGDDYNGNVIVTAKRLATDNPLLSDIMPGGLLGTAENGNTVTLGSMGMIAVELRDGSGNELNLKPGTTAEVTFPIADNQKASAPSEIKLWSFDEAQGLWIEEGIATKSGDNYVASVGHFSFWNCDAPFPVVGICGKVKYSDGSFAPQVQITITSEDYGVGYGWTNADGSYSGKVPKGKVLTLKVFNYLCSGDESITEIEVGPFENKTTLDDIIIDFPSEHTWEGSVVCEGDPVPNATVIYTFEESTHIIESNDDGSFSISVNTECNGTVGEGQVFAINPNDGMASLLYTLSPDTDEVVILEVCNDCEFTLAITDDPTLDICVERGISVEVDGNGTYTYEWRLNGGAVLSTTENVLVGQNSGNYCVTVTESSLECSMVLCSDEDGFRKLDGEIWSSPACDGDNGTIGISVWGGYPDYTFTWSDPSISLNDSIVEGVTWGTYSVTITDTEGCSLELSTEVVAASGITVTLNQSSECYGTNIFVEVSGGVPDYTYVWNPSTGQTSGQSIYVWEQGEYCVTVYDANGCSAQACIDAIINDPADFFMLDVTNCDGGTYTLTNNSLAGADLEVYIDGNNYSIPFGESVEIDFIPTGINPTWVGAYSPNFGCEGELELLLPGLQWQNQEATYTSTDPSCDTCNDGGISLNNNYLSYTELNGAEADGILVLNSDYIDVTADATSNNLGSGTYYVVVTDVNTGCYIFSEKVQL